LETYLSLLKTPPTNHCHVKSLDTASTLDDFIKREVELESGYLTVTDHGYLGACLDAYKLAQKANIKPILGIEGYYYDAEDPILTKFGIEKSKFKEYAKYSHFTLHALDQQAYEALVRAVSEADKTAEVHGAERKFIFNWQVMQGLSKYNFTLSSSCLIGFVGRSLMNERPDIAEAYYLAFRDLFGSNNFYADLYPHVCDRNWVSGVFITLEDGTVLKYYQGKMVKTEKFDTLSVKDLSKLTKKGSSGKLLGVYNRKVFEEFEPKEIIKCVFIEDFIPNECNNISPNGDLQLGLNKFIFDLSRKYGDKLVFAGDDHYAYPDAFQVQNVKLGNLGDNFRFLPGYHRMDRKELWNYYHNVMQFNEKQFEELVNNNFEWASRFNNFKLEYKPSLPESFYPKDHISYLFELIKKHGRMDFSNDKMVNRLKQEIDLFQNNGTINLLPYFFLNEDIVAISERAGKMVGPIRGSAGGSLISFLLGITHKEPVKNNLSLDRFLTPDRIKTGKLPDQDIDFEDRDYVIVELKKKFGDNVAQISTDNLLKLKSSMKDVGRQLNGGQVPFDVMKVAESLPNTPQGIKDKDFIFGYTAEDGKEVKGLWDKEPALREYAAKRPKEWLIVQKSLSLQRNLGSHASAIIICDKPIKDFIPLITLGDKVVTQYTASACEFAGAIKCDILGLHTLSDIGNCLRLIRERSGLKFEKEYTINDIKVPLVYILPHNDELLDIYNLPEDNKVYEDICEGHTETVFQLDTSGARNGLKEFNYWLNPEQKLINKVQDIAAFTSLDRPGPLDAIVKEENIERNMLEEYAARLRKQQSIGEIPFLSKALPDTKGVIIYQEALQSIYQQLTDCTGIEANQFREDIGKKRMSKVLSLYPDFIKKAAQKVGDEDAQKIWDQIYTFGQYGFCYSHAFGYSTLAYACAFLKHYYTLEWWCSVLNNASKDEVAEKFWKHCKHLVLFPDINYSKEKYSIKDDKIIAPLSLIHGVGPGAHQEIMDGLPYKDINDFIQKILKTKEKKTSIDKRGISALNNGVVNKLIISGVLDSLFPINLSAISKLELYNKTFAELNQEKPKKIDEAYRDMNKLREYQVKKHVLPIYSDFLAPYITENISKKVSGNEINYSLNPSMEMLNELLKMAGRKEIWWRGNLPIANGDVLKFLNENGSSDRENHLTVAAIGYVMESRSFNYPRQNFTAHAQSLVLDIDNEIFEFVKWGNWKTGKLTVPTENPECAIILSILTKVKEDKPFSIDSYLILKEPLKG
jgi:DNA-directed DNA polymerase III PolC